MITIADYFKGYAGNPGITLEHEANAAALLEKVNDLLEYMVEQGWRASKNPSTGTMVSGQTDGGWRPQECTTGAPNSAHKQGRAVDVADRSGDLDVMLNDSTLEEFGLYREAPGSTNHWTHLTDRAPASGHRTFYP